jgi:alanyl-tRNA synthetase
MHAQELRQKYLDFFTSKGHTIISSASLIPENDPTVLFTTAGMHPLVPYLLGEKHAGGKRLADVQKCIRTDDIDEVGDNTHHTFFEMLGNWSLGDYFKKEAIAWSYEFLTSKEWLGLDKERIAVSVFAGDQDAPFDQEAYELWKSLGIPEQRIAKLPKKNNWWGPAGQTGPCGPDTEMFYWVGDPNETPASFNDDHPNWIEIWNDVFMQYNKQADGTYQPLQQQNVDTGMGLERTLSILNGVDDNYKTELFWPIIEKIQEISQKQYNTSDEIKKSMRIIADHIRAATMIMADDRHLKPSNVEHGYIIRRLIRRAIRHGKLLGINDYFCSKIAIIVIDIFKDVYPETARNKDFVLAELEKEEELFERTLHQGLREFEKLVAGFQIAYEKTGKQITEISGKQAFKLYDTYGFPLEMTKELAMEKGLKIDEEGFHNAFSEHQALSRAGAEQKFKGGLADHGEQTTKLHTATHLLHQALRTVLGNHVQQKGSNITEERLRFDFSHPEKMTTEQLQQVESIVNEQIQKELPVFVEEMTVEEAKKSGALGFFEHKYGEKVKVYTVGKSTTDYFSKEICGGPHVKNTKELHHFKILKEEASSAGVRRIKAIVD